MPSWVRKASKKYMDDNKQIVDLVGDAGDQTASGVEVIWHIACCFHHRWKALTLTICESSNLSHLRYN